jgi:hypothetical protein
MLNIILQDEKFANNKYRNWYISIIQNRLANPIIGDEYAEKHHIVPKSIVPAYKSEKSNLVKLTAKEHFICHLLLTKFTKDKDYFRMCKALSKMTQNFYHERRFTAGYYSLARRANSEAMRKYNPAKSASVRARLSEKSVGRKHSEETKKKISLSNKGRVSPNRGKTLGPRSIETKQKISETKKGQTQTEEHKRKAAAARLGRPRGKYKRHNQYKRAACVHCGMVSTIANISRWHNTNCKHA